MIDADKIEKPGDLVKAVLQDEPGEFEKAYLSILVWLDELIAFEDEKLRPLDRHTLECVRWTMMDLLNGGSEK